MTQDELEFLIVQHVDGTLPLDEQSRLDAILAVDASARTLLTAHQRLANALRADVDLDVDHEWLSAQIASRVDDEAEYAEARRFRMPRWSMLAPMAAAACLLITLTLGVVFHRDDGEPIPHASRAADAPLQVASVTVPVAEGTNEPKLMSVSIGAPANMSPSLVTALFLAEQFPSPGRIIIRPAGPAHTSSFD